MAVNGIKIAVGQVWRRRDGQEARIVQARPARGGASGWGIGQAARDDDLLIIDNRGVCDLKLPEYDIVELVKDEHGFTIWRGGAQPDETRGKAVFVKLRDGTETSAPVDAVWMRGSHTDTVGDIVAYKVAAVAPSVADKYEQLVPSATVSTVTLAEPGYELLADVLHRAFNQAALGKGKERHANGEPFDEQVMQDGARRFGAGALLFQAFKKSEESQRLPLDRGVNELLGAIVYLAGAVIRREADAAKGGAQ